MHPGSGPSRDRAGGGLVIRRPVPDDYPHVAAALGEWMAPARVELLLPRGSLTHCADTSLVAIEPGDDAVAGFLIAFVPGEHPEVGYVHFVWVSPEQRGQGLGRRLYRGVLDLLRAKGCTMVEAVTGRANHGAIAFHRRLGFTIRDRASALATGADLVPDEVAVLMTLRL